VLSSSPRATEHSPVETVHQEAGSTRTLPGRLVAVLVIAALFVVAAYLVSTVGLQALRSSTARTPATPGTVPDLVYNAPETVPTTAEFGPVGAVSLVFAGSDVLTGLSGKLDNPWIMVSAHTGDYRALSAPHRPDPRPDAVTVSPDGSTLAWGFQGGLVLYDPVTDDAREITDGVGADPEVGAFSPDGRHLVVHDGTAKILDTETGRVIASLSGVTAPQARQAVWTPSGVALTYGAPGGLVTHAWRSDARTTAAAPIPPTATLAWQPSGDRLGVMRHVRGVGSVDVFDVGPNGRLTKAFVVAPDGYSLQELLGFTGDTRVSVRALTLETGPLEIVYSMSTVDTAQPSQVMQLPGPGSNWVGAETLDVATEPLARGSRDFGEPQWPWSHLAKLVSCVVLAVFLAGLYLTRRPRG
jgi:hypothetical protein